jgi:hypothetical protein
MFVDVVGVQAHVDDIGTGIHRLQPVGLTLMV